MSELFRSALGYFGPPTNGNSGAAENDLFIGEVVNLSDRKIKIIKLIAEGGFSYVFQGQDFKTGELVALKKILTPDAESKKAVEEEINYMRNFNHLNIVKFFGSVKNNMEHLIVMEYCRINLPQLPLTFNHTGQVFYQTCRAIEYLHQFGIVHRDIKLQNILVGDDGFVKIIDFGSATLEKFHPNNDWSAAKRNIVEENIAQKTTPMYRSPEMLDLWLNYPIDERCDLWALGCLLFTFCYNSHPFQDSNKLAIVNANYTIPKNDSTYIPYVPLTKGLLKVDPNDRIGFNNIFEILSSIADCRGIKLSSSLPFAPPEPSSYNLPQPVQESGKSGLFSSIKGGAESLFKNIKESSQKYMSTVAPPPNPNPSFRVNSSSRSNSLKDELSPALNVKCNNNNNNNNNNATKAEGIAKPDNEILNEDEPPLRPNRQSKNQNIPSRPTKPAPPLVELMGFSFDDSNKPKQNEPTKESHQVDNNKEQVGDLLVDFMEPSLPNITTASAPTNNEKSNWGNFGMNSNNDNNTAKVDLLGDPFEMFGSGPATTANVPTLASSTSFHDLHSKSEKIVKNTSTPNLSDLILDDIIGFTNNNKSQQPQQQQSTVVPPKIEQTEKPRANYSRQLFAEPEKKQNLNDVFGDLLNEQGFSTSTKNTGLKTMNDLRRVEMLREMDPLQVMVNDWREGKRKNIRALLSSLHLIVWEKCNWKETNMSEMITPAQVKKTYRKACLAIHPDKQMNTENEELAKMIFIELNEAWAAFEENQS